MNRRKKGRTYALSAILVMSGFLVDTKFHNLLAQETTPSAETSKSEIKLLRQQLELMGESMQKQQEQMQAIQNRIEAIAAEKSSPGTITTPTTTAQAAPVTREEVKQEVDNYLSTKEAHEKLGLSLPNMATAEYTPDDEKYALGFKTNDGKFSLNTGARMQFRYTFKDRDEDAGQNDLNDINLRRARVYFGGNIYSKIVHYYVEFDADKFNLGLRDFYVYFTPLEELNAKIGYFKVPFNRQRMSSSSKLLFQDRSIASEAFDQDRDVGFDIYGKPFDGHVEYHAAVFQGAGEKFSGVDNTDNKLMYVLGARYNPFGKYDYYDETDVKYSEKVKATVGAAVTFDPKIVDVKQTDTNGITGTVDLGVKYKGISWNNEYYVRRENPDLTGSPTVDSDGLYTQIGYFVIPKKLEFDARYSMVDPNKDAANDLQKEYAVGVNYYFRDHRSKIQADVGHYATDAVGENIDENRIRLQYQIIF
ncbi:MAG TPA: porin [Candidatus Brocadiaceae bacterium]